MKKILMIDLLKTSSDLKKEDEKYKKAGNGERAKMRHSGRGAIVKVNKTSIAKYC